MRTALRSLSEGITLKLLLLGHMRLVYRSRGSKVGKIITNFTHPFSGPCVGYGSADASTRIDFTTWNFSNCSESCFRFGYCKASLLHSQRDRQNYAKNIPNLALFNIVLLQYASVHVIRIYRLNKVCWHVILQPN